MSNALTDNSETNAILASGLAIVGLLGVAGTFIPTGLLPGHSQNGSQTSQVEAIATAPVAGEADSAPHAVGNETVATQVLQAAQSAGKELSASPLETQADRQPQSVPLQKAASSMSTLMEVPREVMRAAEQALAEPKPQPPGVDLPAVETTPVERATGLTTGSPGNSQSEAGIQPPAVAQAHNQPAKPVPAQQFNPWSGWRGSVYPNQGYPQPYYPQQPYVPVPYRGAQPRP